MKPSLDLKKDVKNRTKARKEAERQTDWDTWGDRVIILAIIALPGWIIIRFLMG